MQELVSIMEAENAIRKHTKVMGDESLPLAESTALTGRVLRQDIVADRPLPPYDRVMMDGIAVSAEAVELGQRSFTVMGTQFAGQKPLTLHHHEGCIEVMTGSVLPEGSDCVIPVEQLCQEASGLSLSKTCQPKVGQHIHRAGSDSKMGEQLVPSGTTIGSPELAIAASCGYAFIRVARLPRVMILSTGDELVSPDCLPEIHQIRRSHATALRSMIEDHGLGVVDDRHVADEPEAIRDAIQSSLGSHDVLVLTGGVSMGKHDYVAPILQELLGDPHFHGVAQKPGKPFAYWTADDAEAAVFCLPGNPVSVVACAARYLSPALQYMQLGRWPEAQRLLVEGSFRCPATLEALVPCTLSHGKLTLQPASNSGNFLALAGTHGVVELPGCLSGKALLDEQASFYPW